MKKPKIVSIQAQDQKQYGYFNDKKEYVITRPDTPKPWINYLGNEIYHALISQTGGGFGYYRDSKLHRVLSWEDHRSDRPGRYIFMKDSDDIWCPNWQPFRKPLGQWQAKHGFGYSEILAKHHGVSVHMTYFVPPKYSCEIWRVTVQNESSYDKQLKCFPFVHFLCGDFYMEQDFKNILLLYNEAYFDPSLNAIVAFKYPTSSRQMETYGFFASSETPTQYELSHEKFVGLYGSISAPEELKTEKFSNVPLRGESMVGVFDIPVSLKAGEQKTFVFCLGFVEEKNKISEIISSVMDPNKAEKLLQNTKNIWKQKLSPIQVQTPDPNFDLMTNDWGKYQLLHITQWRSACYYNAGEGGRGYRDTAQDIEGVMPLDPELSKSWVERLLAYQYDTGHAVAGFSDINGPWEIGSNTGILGKGDVAVWIPYMVSAYLKESGDDRFLKKVIPYLGKGEGTVWDHCLRSMDHFWKSRGKNGLPLFWKADWNDALDRCGIQGKGESVWLGFAYARALLMMEEMAIHMKRENDAKLMRARYDEMNKILNTVAWDGDWYRAIFTDSGKILGSKDCTEGKIFLNSQSWSILSEVAPSLRAQKCLNSVEKHLETEFGPALFSPFYTQYDPEIGRITSFAPGTKENAAIFSHACAFMVVALAMMKQGNKAHQLFSKIAPYNPAKTLATYQTEPYVYAEYVYGPGNAQFGLGAFTWNTGTAPWMYLAAIHWIIGVRPTFDGLLIDPVVPNHWKQFSIERVFRGATYQITFENPKGVQSGVKEIVVDGKKIEGNVVPVLPTGKVHHVKVVMG